MARRGRAFIIAAGADPRVCARRRAASLRIRSCAPRCKRPLSAQRPSGGFHTGGPGHGCLRGCSKLGVQGAGSARCARAFTPRP